MKQIKFFQNKTINLGHFYQINDFGQVIVSQHIYFAVDNNILYITLGDKNSGLKISEYYYFVYPISAFHTTSIYIRLFGNNSIRRCQYAVMNTGGLFTNVSDYGRTINLNKDHFNEDISIMLDNAYHYWKNDETKIHLLNGTFKNAISLNFGDKLII